MSEQIATAMPIKKEAKRPPCFCKRPVNQWTGALSLSTQPSHQRLSKNVRIRLSIQTILSFQTAQSRRVAFTQTPRMLGLSQPLRTKSRIPS